jgi:hypothetical protein
MTLEAFLIFFSAFLSMNTNPNAQQLDTTGKGEQKEHSQPASNAEGNRGGWDFN